MYLSKLKKLDWQPYQIARGSNDTGTVTMRGIEKIGKGKPDRDHFIEIGWYVLKKIGEKARLITNEKHHISMSTGWEVDPDEPLSFAEFIEALPWRDAVAKTLPEDTFK